MYITPETTGVRAAARYLAEIHDRRSRRAERIERLAFVAGLALAALIWGHAAWTMAVTP